MKIRILAIVGLLFFQCIAETNAHRIKKSMVINNEIAKVEKRLKNGRNPNKYVRIAFRDPYVRTLQTKKVTFLHVAVRWKRQEMVRLLLDNDANINAGILDLRSSYSYFGSYVLRSSVALDGATPLYLAVLNNDYDIARLLLERSADPNISTTKYGGTPLHIAILKKNVKMITLLIKNKADICKPNSSNITPLVRLCQHREANVLLNKLGIKRITSERTGIKSALIASVETSNLDLAKTLLQKGADLRIQDKNGNTALHHAAFISDAKGEAFAKLFTSYRTDILDIENKDGLSPLGVAHQQSKIKLFKYLESCSESNSNGVKPGNAISWDPA